MKKLIRSATRWMDEPLELSVFVIYLVGGDTKRVTATNIYEAIFYACFKLNYRAENIYKVEQV